MKKIYFLLAVLMISISSFSQTYMIYTAKKSGKWDDADIWNIELRKDQVKKNKVVIPEKLTITADDNVNNMNLGDVEIEASGTIKLSNKAIIKFGSESVIQLLGNGMITTAGTQQELWIGSVLKYEENKDKDEKGPSYASKATGTSPLGFLTMSSLPVNFVSFTVTKNNSSIMLSWSVSEQVNNDHYEIEKSLNGTDWKQIAIVLQSADNLAIENYSFTDKEAGFSIVYYRIKQVDKDGQSQYSAVKFIKLVTAFANSATVFAAGKNRVTIRFDKDLNKDINVRLVNISGNVYKEQAFKKAGTQLNINVNTMPAGLCVVQMNDNAGWVETEMLMIQ